MKRFCNTNDAEKTGKCQEEAADQKTKNEMRCVIESWVNDQFRVVEVTSDVHAKNYQHRKTRSRRIANTYYFLSFNR